MSYSSRHTDGVYSNRVLGQKRYELTNHLGNVMAVLTDKRTEEKLVSSATLPADKKTRASLYAAYDYYPFGMLMPERYIEDNTAQCTQLPVGTLIYKQLPISVAAFLFMPTKCFLYCSLSNKCTSNFEVHLLILFSTGC